MVGFLAALMIFLAVLWLWVIPTMDQAVADAQRARGQHGGAQCVNDEIYRPKPQSNQLEIFGLGMAGEQDVAEAKKWIEANPEAWRFMLSNARRLKEKGYVSINYLVNMVRNELHVGCKNGIAPALARIMEARYPELRGAFNKHRSQSDGFSE